MRTNARRATSSFASELLRSVTEDIVLREELADDGEEVDAGDMMR